MSLAELREELARRGVRLIKRLGQHILFDPNLNAAIARTALQDGCGKLVLEVGPGTGMLTEALLAMGARVVAVEIDRKLATFLRERFERELLSKGPGSLRLLEADILSDDAINPEVASALAEELSGLGFESFRVAGNLPYSVATRFLLALAGSGLSWSGGAVVVQRELAGRLVASPGTREYGPSGILWQLLARGRIERWIGRECFWPRPQVDSALMAIEPVRAGDPLSGQAVRDFSGFLKRLFAQRRKVIRTALAWACSLESQTADSELRRMGIDGLVRAEELAPDVLLALWQRFRRGD